MASGIEMIRQERKEQIQKHKRTIALDRKHNKAGELIKGALFCLGKGLWPKEWNVKSRNKITLKSPQDRLAVAGAFYMAEQDRIGKKNYYSTEIRDIAKQIDELQKTAFQIGV